jgi:putative toxin-antitoxin system antitoxin component (TIGR02293 family)
MFSHMAVRRLSDMDELRLRMQPGRRGGHHYVALLGLRAYDPVRIYATVREGIPYSAFEHARRNTGFATDRLAAVTRIPMRTLARRKVQGRFDPDESDRLVRFSRLFGRALELFEGDVDAAREWLSTPQQALGNIAPLDLGATDIGATEVERLIGRLEYGVPV